MGAGPRKEPAICAVPDCPKIVSGRRLCILHYTRMRFHGNVQGALRNCQMCGDYFWGHGRANFCSVGCKKPSLVLANKVARELDIEPYRDYHETYRKAHREVAKVRQRAYYADNRQHYADYMDQYRKDNPEVTERYIKNNPDKIRLRQSYARLKRRGLKVGKLQATQRSLTRLRLVYQGRCAYCREPLVKSFHWDHVIPLSRGGHNGEGNLVPACARCNLTKHASTIMEWRLRIMRRESIDPVGNGVAVFGTPSIDPGSAWFTRKTGEVCPPGLLALTVCAGKWSNHSILS